MTTGFRATNKTESIGALSGFNVWSYAVIAEEILRMSFGCGGETGDTKEWYTVRKGLKKRVAVKWLRTCNDRKGESSTNLFFCFVFIYFPLPLNKQEYKMLHPNL